MVVASEDNADEYIVLEGNRRLTALRILENPNLAVGVVSPKLEADFIKVSKQFKSGTLRVHSAMCVVFDELDEADYWREIRHIGEGKGKGIVPWRAQEKARYKDRKGGKKKKALQVLDFLENRGNISNDTRKNIPTTILWINQIKFVQ